MNLREELKKLEDKYSKDNILKDYDWVFKNSKKWYTLNLISNDFSKKLHNSGGKIFSVFFEENKNNFIFYTQDLYFYCDFLVCKCGPSPNIEIIKINYTEIDKVLFKKVPSPYSPDLILLELLYSYKSQDFSTMLGTKEGKIQKFLDDIIPLLQKYCSDEKEKIEKEKRLEEQKQKQIETEKLDSSRDVILKELDVKNDGELNVIEGNDFNLLLKKHQKKIIEIDRNYIQQFVKVSTYIKTKKNNIQLIFESVKNTPSLNDFEQYSGILKNEIHSYQLILFNSLNMVISLVEDDMITFYEIHDSFDKLNMFNSNWENEVSNKLTDIGDGLKDLMESVNDMSNKVVNEIGNLTYVTQESNKVLSEQLQGIDSSLQVNNLLTGIQTYKQFKT